jgi:hypothetical protein
MSAHHLHKLYVHCDAGVASNDDNPLFHLVFLAAVHPLGYTTFRSHKTSTNHPCVFLSHSISIINFGWSWYRKFGSYHPCTKNIQCGLEKRMTIQWWLYWECSLILLQFNGIQFGGCQNLYPLLLQCLWFELGDRCSMEFTIEMLLAQPPTPHLITAHNCR